MGVVLMTLGVVWIPYRFIAFLITEPSVELLDLFPVVLFESFGTVVFLAIIKGYRIINDIQINNKPTLQSVQPLNQIRIYAMIAVGILVLSMPIFFYVAETEDAPGVAALALTVLLASGLVVSISTLWHKLLINNQRKSN
jgi:hypothetical protein